MPRSPGRVAVTIQDGKQVYVRDGQVFQAGGFGGGLEEAVAGNQAAVAAAQEFKSRLVTGFVATILGSIALGAGAGWLGATAADSSSNSGDLTAPLILTAGGFVAMMVGAGYAGSAEPYRWDAINLYNDGAAASPMPRVPGPGTMQSPGGNNPPPPPMPPPPPPPM